jgi:hypothetical protein
MDLETTEKCACCDRLEPLWGWRLCTDCGAMFHRLAGLMTRPRNRKVFNSIVTYGMPYGTAFERALVEEAEVRLR